jgi:hypothetical protein
MKVSLKVSLSGLAVSGSECQSHPGNILTSEEQGTKALRGPMRGTYRIGRSGSRREHLDRDQASGVAMSEVPKHRRLSKDDVMQLMRLLISAIEPVARLIDAISHIRLQATTKEARPPAQ